MAFTFQIEIGNTKARKNEINKNFITSSSLTFTCTLIEASSRLEPSVLIDTDEMLFSYNYAHTINPEQYYFIQNVHLVGNSLWRLDLKIDVLMTYATTIFNSNAYIERCTLLYDKTLKDDALPVSDRYLFSITKYANVTLDPTDQNSWKWIIGISTAVEAKRDNPIPPIHSTISTTASAPDTTHTFSGISSVNQGMTNTPPMYYYIVKNYETMQEIITNLTKNGLASCILYAERSVIPLYTPGGTSYVSTNGLYVTGFSWTRNAQTGLIIISESGETNITQTSAVLEITGAVHWIKFASFKISSGEDITASLRFHNNEYYLYVPFSDSGYVKLNNDLVVDRYVQLYYVVDPYSSSAKWVLFGSRYDGDASTDLSAYIIDSGDAQLIRDFSLLNTSEYDDSVRREQIKLNNILNAGVATMMKNNLEASAIRTHCNYKAGKGSTDDYLPRYALLISYTTVALGDTALYLQEKGKPVNKYGAISKYINAILNGSYAYGFIKASNITLPNDNKILSAEREEIENIFNQGVVITK